MTNLNINLKETFTALFKDTAAAEKAYELALQKGYRKEDINIFMSEDTKHNNYGNKLIDNADIDRTGAVAHEVMEGAGVGGAIGTTVGAIAGAVAAIGTNLILPGLGLVIAGPIVAGLAGAGAGGIAGGVIGALVNVGISEQEAAEYAEGIEEGGIVISVPLRSEEVSRALENEWRAYGGTNFLPKQV